MYPTPDEPEPDAIVSTWPVIDEFIISIFKIWPLTGATSFELGFAVTRIEVEATPSTFDMEFIIAEAILMTPVI